MKRLTWRLAALVVALVVLRALPSPGALLDELITRAGVGSSAGTEEGTYRPPKLGRLPKLLKQVDVVPDRPDVGGYDVECGTGHACSYGPAWSDDTGAPLAHNGCDTRNDLLARSMTQLVYRDNTHECVVIAGVLDDPYTGQRIEFRKEAAHEVGIDHLIPRARAWDLGAWKWTPEQRATFANDPANLIAVSGRANSSKSDRGPGEWLPINANYRCTYIARYLAVSISYDLPITQADHSAARLQAKHCRAAHPR